MTDRQTRQASAVAVGNFDGFHLGHQRIVDTLKEIAVKERLLSMILTFTPNPRVYFDKDVPSIHTDAQKRRALETHGVERIVFLDFAPLAGMSGEDFLREFLIDRFHMKYMVVGENFHFGRARLGDIGSLQGLAGKFDFRLEVVKSRLLDAVRISSSLIRVLLAKGQIEEATRMLGRLYCIEGEVTAGDGVGRELGFPTINISTDNTLLPEGVFQTKVEIDGEMHDSITNIGFRPTFTGKEKRVESHIFDFDRTVYGKSVRIFFERKLRDEIRFVSGQDLVEQIKKDIARVKVDKDAFF